MKVAVELWGGKTKGLDCRVKSKKETPDVLCFAPASEALVFQL